MPWSILSSLATVIGSAIGGAVGAIVRVVSTLVYALRFTFGVGFLAIAAFLILIPVIGPVLGLPLAAIGTLLIS